MAKKRRQKYKSYEKAIIKNVKLNRDHICYYCKKEIIEKEDLTVDHKSPYNGTNTTYGNCEICCSTCNIEKGCKNENQYNDYLSYKNKISKLSKNQIKIERERVVNLLRLGEQFEDGIFLRYKAQATHVLLKSV